MELYYLIAIIARDKREDMASIYRSNGVGSEITKLGHGTATSEHLSIYGLDATEKAIISAVANAEEATKILKAAKRKMFIDIPGNGIMMTVPLKSVAGGRTLAYLSDTVKTGGTPKMEFSHELIIAILNEGYSDFVMDFARAAGAGGGTVLHAKGSGRSRGEKFFGVSLADEKDVIYIVAKSSEKAAIMKTINENAGPDTKAGAICFSLPVSSVVGLRESDD